MRIPVFRALWVAGLLSSLGSWVHMVAAAWLMTSLTSSVAPVALLLTASSIPTFALALPAGALADVVDRRRLIILTQSAQALVTAVLAGLALTGTVTSSVLLSLTVALAAATTLSSPVMLAVMPELVSREQLPAAIALNSTAFTLAQAVGPMLGGVIVAVAGPGAAFTFNAVSFLAVVAVAVTWRRARPVATLPAEHVLGAIRTGLRYIGHAPALGVVLSRAAFYALSFAAVPALLPVVSRVQVGTGAGGYGLMLGSLGLGGLAGSLLLPRLRARFDHERLVMAALCVYAAVLVALSQANTLAFAVPVLGLAGLAGMTIMSTLNIAAQSAVPAWVRGRGLAVYQLTFAAAMALGAAGWGVLATAYGISVAMISAACALLANVAVALRLRLSVADGLDTRPLHADTPLLDAGHDPDDGPVLVTIHYRVDDEDAFRSAMRSLGTIRKRDGALHWGVFQDLVEPQRHVESFLVTSWAEYERLQARAIVSDGPVLAIAEQVHSGEGPPHVHRYLGHHHHHRGPLLAGDE